MPQVAFLPVYSTRKVDSWSIYSRGRFFGLHSYYIAWPRVGRKATTGHRPVYWFFQAVAERFQLLKVYFASASSSNYHTQASQSEPDS
jgi:hypothetical protein